MKSIYSRLFSYRQNDKLSPTETYLTEILGYCLEYDKDFFKEFIELIGFNNCDESLQIKTQSSYATLGRPDIEMISSNYHIIIECKVEALERTNQLSDYTRILRESNKKNIRLVYLTKYIENKESTLSKEQFIQICWYDIAKHITQKNQFFTIEFKNYLTEMNMSNIRYFSAIDLATLKALSATIEKMDDTLDAVRPYYIENFGGISKNSARSTALKNRCYINWQNFTRDKKLVFDIAFGYYWFFQEDEIPVIGLRVWVPTYGKDYETNEFYKFFSRELKKWDIEETDSGIVIANYKYLSDFMTFTHNDEQLREIIDFFKIECIDEIIKIKNKFPNMFINQGSVSEINEDML